MKILYKNHVPGDEASLLSCAGVIVCCCVFLSVIILFIIMKVGCWNTEVLKLHVEFVKCSMPGLCAWFVCLV